MSSNGDDIALFLEIPYFHGFIPRDDLPFLLKKKGEFLLRCSDVEVRDSKTQNRMEKKEYIVSVCSGEKRKRSPKEPGYQQASDLNVRNLVLYKDPAGKWYLYPSKRFDTLMQIVDYYKANDLSYKNKISVRLVAGVSRAKWELQHTDITLGIALGKGEFGEVRKGVFKVNREKEANVAIKLTKGVSELSKAKRNQMMAEARIMRYLHHPNVVRLYGIGVLQQPLYIVLELVDAGSLDSYLRSNRGKLTTEQKTGFILDASAGIEFIHAKKVIHRDLAARNCLIQASHPVRPCVKISDFGLSRMGDFYKLKVACKVPIKWLAPETIVTFSFTMKSDVWSFGVVVYEIFSEGREPWEKRTNTEVKQLLAQGRTFDLDCLPDKLRQYTKDSIWCFDQTKRPSMSEITTWLEKFAGTKKRTVDPEDEADDMKDIKDQSASSSAADDSEAADKKKSGGREPNQSLENDDEGHKFPRAGASPSADVRDMSAMRNPKNEQISVVKRDR